MTRWLVFVCCLWLAPTTSFARVGETPHLKQYGAVRDLSGIRSAGVLRVLVNQSRASSGEFNGEAIGTEYRRLEAFERYLNKSLPKGRPLKVVFIPKPKSELLPALLKGEGDLVAPGELLAGPLDKHLVRSDSVIENVPLVVVGKKGHRRLGRLEQLSGRQVVLPVGSAAEAPLRELNQQLIKRKLKPIKLESVDPSLAVEDVLEMVNAGIFPLAVVEQPIAERWAKILPKLRVERRLVVAKQQDMTWVVRRGSPNLRTSLNHFLADYRLPSSDAAFQQAYQRMHKVRNPLGKDDHERLVEVRPVLQRYASTYDLDWLTLAAMAYKESGLDGTAKGSGGATGLMQITPSAARSVGVKNIRTVDGNVQAAARYMAKLRKNFFSSRLIDERERRAFVLAAYNMGPERVQRLRAKAKKQGLDPNKWFFQVERIAAEEIGMGVVSYVSSVNKYYLAYARERSRLEPGQRSSNLRLTSR
ncbi:membrane-bound lytic murein transglycosylase MltF [Pseudomonas duriflava]|uniref:Membrane-bound lytic murein transglycosylase MltF n=1 Tax=Pseudomonas duriflava TaxID=459528 RepID=A0A562Q9L9_9PSED|nr:transglycosylase SLT domain-containing protein [Pseudomonas duriflava]TWI53452.1 membrane-bound lytic murein transglycosylase MltF [Pseudomonas duriflava]